MRVVILGARGFVARALADALSAAHVPVRAISRHEIDLLNGDAVERLAAAIGPDDTVVMPAALTPDRGRDVATLMKNLKMAETVCQALTRAACAHLVYVSSDAVYPNSPDPITEETPCSPTDLYALMHTAREQMLGHVARERGLPYCILRPCAIYGASDTHNSYGPNRFVRTAMAEQKIRLFGAGEEERDHIYIDDVVTVIIHAVRQRTTGIVNVVTGSAMSFRAIADLVGARVGGRVAIESAARTGPVTHRHFNPARLRQVAPDIAMTSFDDGIARIIETMRTSAV